MRAFIAGIGDRHEMPGLVVRARRRRARRRDAGGDHRLGTGRAR